MQVAAPQAVAAKKPAQPEPVYRRGEPYQGISTTSLPSLGARCEAIRACSMCSNQSGSKVADAALRRQLVLRADRVASGFTLTKASDSQSDVERLRYDADADRQRRVTVR